MVCFIPFIIKISAAKSEEIYIQIVVGRIREARIKKKSMLAC